MDDALARLARMRMDGLWPGGQRHSRADAFGLLLLLSLHRASGDERHLEEAQRLVEAAQPRAVVSRLGATVGGRDADTFHLAVWTFALGRFARIDPAHQRKALELAHSLHERVLANERSAARTLPPGSSAGLAVLEPFAAYVACRSLETPGLSDAVDDLRERIERNYRDLVVTQDLPLGMMLWLTHFHPQEPWAELQRGRCLRILEHLWVEPAGCFCREPGAPTALSLGGNAALAIGLQAVAAMPDRERRIRHRPVCPLRDEDAVLANVLACCADVPGELLRARRSSRA
jgi:hypothetical protein